MTASPYLRLATILATIGVLAFTLTACGRRGPLDPPPLSASQSSQRQPQQGQQQQPQQPQEQAAVDTAEDDFGTPMPVPRGQKKPFPLDGLLN